MCSVVVFLMDGLLITSIMVFYRPCVNDSHLDLLMLIERSLTLEENRAVSLQVVTSVVASFYYFTLLFETQRNLIILQYETLFIHRRYYRNISYDFANSVNSEKQDQPILMNQNAVRDYLKQSNLVVYESNKTQLRFSYKRFIKEEQELQFNKNCLRAGSDQKNFIHFEKATKKVLMVAYILAFDVLISAAIFLRVEVAITKILFLSLGALVYILHGIIPSRVYQEIRKNNMFLKYKNGQAYEASIAIQAVAASLLGAYAVGVVLFLIL